MTKGIRVWNQAHLSTLYLELNRLIFHHISICDPLLRQVAFLRLCYKNQALNSIASDVQMERSSPIPNRFTTEKLNDRMSLRMIRSRTHFEAIDFH